MRLKFLCEVQQTIWTRGRKAQNQLNVKQRLHYLILPAKTISTDHRSDS